MHDLTKGPILKSIIWFALPILISNIFQQLYNMADTVIVGYFLGPEALAAVGATTSIFDLIIGFTIGVGNGMGVIIARNYGAQNNYELKKSVAASMVIGLVLSGLVMLVGQFGLYPLLEILGTPNHIIQQSYDYIYVILMCVGVSFTYNLAAGLLRAIGNSLTALYFLVFSAALNVVLDLYFIQVLQLGVRSAGIATIVSQGLASLLCFVYIYRKVPILVPQKEHFIMDKALYADLLAQGLSMGIGSSIISTGSLILQSSVNSFGVAIIAAQTTARRVMYLILQPFSALGSTMVTFISQNVGAKQAARIRSGVKVAAICSVTWGTLACGLLYISSPSVTQFLSGSNNPDIIDNATSYLRISSAFYPVLGLLFLFNSTLQGLGKKVMPMASSIFEMLGKWIFVILVIPHTHYMGVILCEPLLWIGMVILLYPALRQHPVFQVKET